MQPELAIVVDTEEEFDWTRPVARESRSTRSIQAQPLAHRIYDALGVVPTYVVDHPVATDPEAVAVLGDLQRSGRAEIGAHLHPWVSPPHDEALSVRNSYHCNLPPALERAKIVTLTDTIAGAFGIRPRIFKAGRYGFGPNTRAVLIDLGYEIDCSYVAHASFAGDGGPTYVGKPDQPFWHDAEHQLLEVPLTSGFFGLGARMGPRIAGLFDSATAARWRIPGLLGRSGILSRSRLTPEGVSAAEQCRLLAGLVAQGQRRFTMAYHSPSLAIGHTPYVRSEADLAQFLESIDSVLRHFRDHLGGRFTTLTAMRSDIAEQGLMPA